MSAAIAVSPVGASAGPPPDAVDCARPAGNPAPDTAEWRAREVREAFCGEQRASDTAANPLFHLGGLQMLARDAAPVPQDPYRDPLALNGIRFRYETLSFTAPNAQRLDARLYRPCDDSCRNRSPELRAFKPPYPAVVVVHGGSADQAMYWWGVQPLAEAGYMVLTFQVPTAENTGPAAFPGYTKAALDFLFATPTTPTASGEFNPRWSELGRKHVGLAGHSAGGVAVSRVGQEDPRVGAIVSWDRAQSSTMPADLRLRTPALFMTADYNCQQVPVCVPQPYTSPSDPLGPGNKDEDFRRLRAAGVDTMKIALRSATHLDFTQFAPAGTGSRYGAAVASYYTLAWFNRYLRGGSPKRLVAKRFDRSGDVHNISGGQWDPVAMANVPAYIAGMRVVDRLSFRFRSGYWLNGGDLACEDVRAGCRTKRRRG